MKQVLPLIDRVNLMFHEGGHMIFRLLGTEFLTVLGGTLMQLTLPLAAYFHFMRRKEKFASALILLWFGENFLGIGNYMKDAMVQELPLLGDGTHDWTYLFGTLGILQYCRGIGNSVIFLGYVIMAIAVYLMVSPLAEKWRSRGKGTAVGGLLLALAFRATALAAPVHISSDELLQMQVARTPGLIVVDVRSPAEYVSGHIAGSINVLAEALNSAGLPRDAKIAVYCSAQTCDLADNAANSLAAEGLKDVSVLEGGIELWRSKGYPIETGSNDKEDRIPIPTVSTQQILKELEGGGIALIDVRHSSEYAAGHLPGALSLPLEEIVNRAHEIPAGKEAVVYDKTAARSQAAAKILKRQGRKVSELSGGILAWIKKKMPLEIKQ